MNSKCAVRRKLQRNMQNKWKSKTNGPIKIVVRFHSMFIWHIVPFVVLPLMLLLLLFIWEWNYCATNTKRFSSHRTNDWTVYSFFFQIWFEYTIAIAAYFQIWFYWLFAVDLASIEILLFRLFRQIKLVMLPCADFINRNDVFFPLICVYQKQLKNVRKRSARLRLDWRILLLSHFNFVWNWFKWFEWSRIWSLNKNQVRHFN